MWNQVAHSGVEHIQSLKIESNKKVQRWMAPIYGCIKLNVDVTVNTRSSFFAVVALDDQEKF
jgi:hypothetical protein